MNTEWLPAVVFSPVYAALDWDITEHLQGFLAKAAKVWIVCGNLNAKHSFQSGLWV